jgi:hypothetical protein
MESDTPRRIDMLRWHPAERAIHDAVQAVEMAGAHPLLTDAVILLSDARRKVADYVDGVTVANTFAEQTGESARLAWEMTWERNAELARIREAANHYVDVRDRFWKAGTTVAEQAVDDEWDAYVALREALLVSEPT